MTCKASRRAGRLDRFECQWWPAWTKLTDHRSAVQRNMATELRNQVGLPLDQAVGISDITKYEDLLQKDIRVWTFSALGPTQIWGPKSGQECRYGTKDQSFHVLCDGNHYVPISNVGHLLGHRYYDEALECKVAKPVYCASCKSHSCPHKDEKPTASQRIVCDDCGRNFKGQMCFDIHRSKTLMTLKAPPST